MLTLDLCSGVGGISMGFDNAGFKTNFACDIEPKCKITYDLNFTKPKLHIQDLFEISPTWYPDFDVLVAGFPCQTFSIAGKRLGFADQTKGTIFFELAEILRIRKPKAFMFENVKNLVGHDEGRTFKVIQDILIDLGYHIHFKVLNTKDFDTPQNRERIFIVGFREDVPFVFPEPLTPTQTIQDLLETDVDEQYFIRSDHKHYTPINEGVTKTDTIYQWRWSYIRENKSKVCPTITASNSTPTLVRVDGGVRKLTPRELFRFQGFPDSYVLPDLPYATLHHQAGNSVSVPVIEAIAKQMKAVM
jgi:DNA (cytosine-5)-methyltransferase 1